MSLYILQDLLTSLKTNKIKGRNPHYDFGGHLYITSYTFERSGSLKGVYSFNLEIEFIVY